MLWNNKENRLKKLPIFYKDYFDADVIYVKDLLFELSTIATVTCSDFVFVVLVPPPTTTPPGNAFSIV